MTPDNPATPPRLYLWEQRVLYSGPAFSPRYRSYGSTALVASMDRPMQVHRQTCAHRRTETSVCLIEPGLPVYIDSCGSPLTVVFLDPLRQDFERIRAGAGRHHDGLWSELRHAEKIRNILGSISDQGPDVDRARELLTSIGVLPGHQGHHEDTDPRVLRSLDLIRQSRTAAVTTEGLAAANNLSVPRVVQLFRHHLGVSAGRYRQWHRLHASALAVASGQTFTQAALGAGFSDLAHYSNTFSTIHGVTPSRPLRCHGTTCFYIDADLASSGFMPMTPIKRSFRPLC